MTQEPEIPAESATLQEHGPSTAEGAVSAGRTKPPGKSTTREWLETVVIALAVAFLIRAFIVQVYLVEGDSMEPTLHTQERLLVNKFIYRLRSPQPGEIVVLQDPTRPQRELIKRVVAVAGETVEVKQGVVYVNGRPLNEPFKNTAFTQYGDTPPIQVPERSVFVMGDNRGRSFDSRMMGPVVLEKVDGKAFFLFWPLNQFAAGPLDQPRTLQR